MKKSNSKQLLALKKANIALLNEKQIENLNGGSSYGTTYTSSSFVTLISECTSIACIPDEDY